MLVWICPHTLLTTAELPPLLWWLAEAHHGIAVLMWLRLTTLMLCLHRFVENTAWILWIPIQCSHQRELLLLAWASCFEMSGFCFHFFSACAVLSADPSRRGVDVLQVHWVGGVGAVTLQPISQRLWGLASWPVRRCLFLHVLLFFSPLFF